MYVFCSPFVVDPNQTHSLIIMHPNSLYMYVLRNIVILQCSNCDTRIRKCYFLLGASASTPLLYYVDRVRDGRSYATRSVRAVQGGRNVFIMVCSFQKPEPWQPSRHWPMPQSPHPDECNTEVEHLTRMAADPDVAEQGRARLIEYAKVRLFYLLSRCLGTRSWSLRTRHTVSREKSPRLLSSMLGPPLTMRDEGR
jgi:acyl-CoA thioesterase